MGYVYEAFQVEMEMIKNEWLKGKVIRTWEEALKIGGWSMEESLQRIPFTLFFETSISLREHTSAVTRAAYKMAQEEEIVYGSRLERKVNFDYLVAGALLHDVGKCVEICEKEPGVFEKSKWGKYMRHPLYGALLAHALDIPKEVIHIIANHSHEGDMNWRSKECLLVMHADFAFFEGLKIK